MSLVITEPAPIIAPLPIVTDGSIVTLVPIQTSLPIITFPFFFSSIKSALSSFINPLDLFIVNKRVSGNVIGWMIHTSNSNVLGY